MFCRPIQSTGELVFTDPRKVLKDEIDELEKLDELELGRKPANKKPEHVEKEKTGECVVKEYSNRSGMLQFIRPFLLEL